MSDLDSALVEVVREAALSDRYAAYLRNTLVELAGIEAPFEFIADEVRALLGDSAQIQHVAANPAGGKRGQLIVQVAGEADAAVVMHANVGSESRRFAPRPAGERVFGCGVCRHKGQAAVLLAQMKLAAEVAERVGQGPSRGCIYRFVSGGGASDDPSGEEASVPVLVLDCTDRTPGSGQYGLVRYRCRLAAAERTGFSAVELFPLVALDLEKEGRRVGREAVAPGFSAERVRPNVGQLGGFGSSTVVTCDHVAIEIEAYARAKPERIAMIVTQLLDAAIVQYVEKHGDKTREIDPATGQPMLERHFKVDLNAMAEASIIRIDVWGCAGHMAATSSGDNAITKAAFLLGALLRMAPKYPNVRATARLADDASSTSEIVLAGAQSFALPLTAQDVEQRLTAAATDGLEKYCQLRRCKFDPGLIEMTFDGANSEADAGALGSVPMQALRKAFGALHEPWPEPTAWLGDGDAKRYHTQGNAVTTFGAGKLDAAYGPNEHIDIPDLQKTLAISTLAAWLMTQ